MLFSKPKTIYLPQAQEWTPEDESNIRSSFDSGFYLSFKKRLENRVASLQSKALTDRDVYSIERMEELLSVIADFEDMKEGEKESVKESFPTRFENYQP